MVRFLTTLWLHFMIILSLWLIYSATANVVFYAGIFFWLYYIVRLYVHNESKSS